MLLLCVVIEILTRQTSWKVTKLQKLLPVQLWYLFSSYKLTTTVTVTLLLFGPVTLLCGTFLCIKLSEGRVQLSD